MNQIYFQKEGLDELTSELEECQLISKTGSYCINFFTREFHFSKGFRAIYEVDEQPNSIDYFLGLIHDEDRSKIEPLVNSINRQIDAKNLSELHFDLNYRIVLRQSQTTKVIKDIVRPRYKNEKLIGIRGVIQDVTCEYYKGRELESAKNELEESQHIAGLGSWKYDTVNNVQTWSSGQCSLYEVEPGEEAKNFEQFLSFIHPDDVPIFTKELPYLLDPNTNAESKEYIFRIIARRSKKTKTIRGVISRSVVDGRVVSVRGINQDITAQQSLLKDIGRISEELRVSNDVLSRAKDDLEETQRIAGVGSWRLDIKTGIIAWSDELKELLELPIDSDPSPETFLKMIHPEEAQGITRLHQRMMEIFSEDPHAIVEGRCRIITNVSKQVKHISFASRAILFDKEIVATKGVIKDITDTQVAYNLLKRSEEKFSNLFNYSGMGMAIVTVDGYFESVNNNLEKLTGYSAIELSKIKLADVTHPNDWNEEQRKTEKLYSKLIPAFEYEKRLISKNKEVRWVVQTTSCVFNDQGNPQYLVVQIRDITEKILAEKKIFETQERFISAFYKSSVGMAIRKLKGDFEEVNDTFCKMLGYRREEILARNVKDVTHPESWKVEEIEIQSILNGKSTGFTLQKQFVHKTGKIIFGLLTVNLIKSAEGVPVNIISQVQDITDLIKSQRIVHQTKEKFEHIFYKSGIGMSLADGAGKFIDVNESLCSMLGYSREELVGATFAKITHPDDLKASFDVNKKLDNGTNQIAFKKRYIQKHGKVIHAIVSIGIITDQATGEKLTIAQVQDISQLVENQQMIERTKEKFEHIFKFSGIGMSIIGENGKMLEVNDALCEMTGYTESELVNLSPQEITHPDDLAENKVLRSRLLRGEINRFTLEKRYIRKNGSILHGLLTASLIEGGENDRRFILGQLQDITELKTQINLRLENERKFRALVENSLVGIVVVENDKVIYANPTLTKMFGYDDFEEFAAKSMVEMALPETRALIEKRNKLAGTGHLVSPLAHGKFFTKQGKVIAIESHTTFIVVGNKILKSSVIVNVTEKDLAQKKLEETNSVFQLAQKFANLGSWRWTIESGALYWSDSIYKIFGFNKKKDTVSFESFLNAIHPEDRVKVESTIQNSLEKQQPYEVEHRILLKNGIIKWVIEKGNVIKNNTNNAVEMYGMVRDITDAKHSAEELEQSKEKYQLLAESGQELICLNTLDGHFIYASPAMKTLLGYNPKKLPKSLCTIDWIHPDDKKHFTELQVRAIKQKDEVFNGRFRFKHKNGKYVWCEKNLKAVTGRDGNVESIRSLTRSIDQQVTFENQLVETNRQLERALVDLKEASEAKENFLSVMSHEIRTPLNSVIGLSNLLVRRNPREDQVEVVKTLKNSADNLMHLVNDILDFNKIRSGNLKLEVIPFSLQDLLRQQFASFQMMAQDKGLSFNFQIDPEIPDSLEGDVTRINQILTNLLTNAIKFTHKGSVKLRCNLNSTSQNTCSITFIVEDTGVGIPTNKQQSIFQPFHQADADISRKYGGTGLGLSIVKSLVELMHGKLELKSTVGDGSSFVITVDMRIQDASVKKLEAPIKSSIISKPVQGKINILYVEDVDSNRFLIDNLLADNNISCTSVSSGRAAVKLAASKKFDLILMDLQMPGMDGYTTTQKIHEQPKGKNKRTPVIAFTAEVYSTALKEKTIMHNIQYVISKPFNPDRLIEKIRFHAQPRKKSDLIFSFAFYESAFDHDHQKIKKIKKTVIADFARFEKNLVKKDKAKDIEGIRAEVHKIRPIVKNLSCNDLTHSIDKFRMHEVYNKDVKPITIETRKKLKQLIKGLVKLSY